MDCLVNFRCRLCIKSAVANSILWVRQYRIWREEIYRMARRSEMDAKAGDYPDV
jgi:hypothetical protein